MPIAQSSEWTATAVSGGDATFDWSTFTPVVGSVVILAYAIGDNDSVDFTMAMVSAGWTKVADVHAPTDTQDCDLGVFWKVMGDPADTSAVVDDQGGADAAVAGVAASFTGVDTTTPMDVTPTTASGNNSNIPDPPSINPVTPGVWTVIIGAFGHTSGFAVGMSPPANYTLITEEAEDDTSDVTVGIAYRDDPSDPEDPGAFTPSIADNAAHTWCAVTIALRPAASADVLFQNDITSIEDGIVAQTAAGMGGVLVT